MLYSNYAVYFSVPAVAVTSFSLVPYDVANGPAACPPHLLYVNEDGTTSPVELVAGAFDLFKGAASQCVFCALFFIHSFKPLLSP